MYTHGRVIILRQGKTCLHESRKDKAQITLSAIFCQTKALMADENFPTIQHHISDENGIDQNRS
jgi:hypothetical protein